MRFITIKTRVTIYFTLMMMLVVALVLIFMLIVGNRVITNNAETTLLDVVHDNIDDVEYKDGYLDLDELNLYRHNVYVLVYDADEQLIGGSGLRHFEGDDLFLNGQTREIDIDGDGYLVYDLYVQDPQGDVWLRGITSTDNSFSAVRIIVILSLVLFPILVLLTAIVGWLIARRAFKPVRQITDTVDAISDGSDLSARIGLKRGRDEIHRLAATFDRMFDRLEHSFDAEKRFASDASHELRTPTAVILAECEYAKQNAKSTEDYAESIEVIERQARRMSELISKLLNITRMDQGTHQAAFERANLSELAEIVTDETAMAAGKAVELKKEIEGGVYANIDVGLMTRLVQNLVENAIKYTPEGGHVTVSLRREGDALALAVADDGIGIAKKDLPHIYDRFWQADASRGADRGSGLGLSMVKQIAEAHGGRLDVKSAPGRGSTFTYRMAASN